MHFPADARHPAGAVPVAECGDGGDSEQRFTNNSQFCKTVSVILIVLRS